MRVGELKYVNLDVSQCKTQEDANPHQGAYYHNNAITEPQATQQDNDCIEQDLYMTNELFARKRILSNTRSISPNKQPRTLELLPTTKPVFDGHRELLWDVFKAYSSYLSSKSDSIMKVTGLVSLLKDADLLKVAYSH